MGNFSRDTFDPLKSYVGVRLQQGVPLVDADWNELNDVTRHETYRAFQTALPDGIEPGLDIFKIVPTYGSANDFYTIPGKALVDGRVFDREITSLADLIRYTAQPWTDSTRAAADGVNVIPDLTTPAADRNDIVYADFWEREVDSVEDGDLINPVINIETCVRLKREVALRVAEGTTTLPAAPQGHHFLPLALLHRTAGQAQLTTSQVEDIRPYISHTKGKHWMSLLPDFKSMYAISTGSSLGSWRLHWFYAVKPQSSSVYGILPIHLPNRSKINRLRVRGRTEGRLVFELMRMRNTYNATLSELYDQIFDTTIAPYGSATSRTFNTNYSISDADRLNVVDNDNYYYGLYVYSDYLSSYNFAARIHGISVEYEL